MSRGIDQQDLKLISDAFKTEGPLETLYKGSDGKIIRPSMGIVNKKGYVIRSFMGRTLCRDKWVIPAGSRQKTLVAKRGERYEDIPTESRKRVTWSEADFT